MKNGKIKLGRYIIEPKTSIDILNADEFNVIKFNTGKVYISKEPMELNKEKFWTTIFCDNKIISKVELSNAEEKYKMNYQTMNDNILKGLLLEVKDTSVMIYPGKFKEWKKGIKYKPVEFGYSNIRELALKRKNHAWKRYFIKGSLPQFNDFKK